jgi:Cdc6-like AAA superfamily ATPase
MTNETKGDPYTGEEAPESQELIDKVRSLSPEAQSVLYAMLIEEGEEEPALREGFSSAEIHQACAACSLDDAATPETLIDAGISELKEQKYVEERNGRLYLITRTEHVRTFEKSVESSMYVVRR